METSTGQGTVTVLGARKVTIGLALHQPSDTEHVRDIHTDAESVTSPLVFSAQLHPQVQIPRVPNAHRIHVMLCHVMSKA